MRILCLDVGEKNIGVAVSDPLGLTAQGLEVIKRQSLSKDLRKIRQLLKDYDVEEIVLGLPRNMNGTIGEKAREILRFKEKLEEVVGIAVTLWDERLTTVAAQRALLEADVSRKGRKKVIDKLAAVFILENYLRYRQRGQ
ncbi:MAG: Holliday junction resolvase RuvX [Firmicutes bacterium]|jgi:putative Holliday junction resolvase|nr:Holliday junction resolvase RuvX [Bacillota bacterium]